MTKPQKKEIEETPFLVALIIAGIGVFAPIREFIYFLSIPVIRWHNVLSLLIIPYYIATAYCLLKRTPHARKMLISIYAFNIIYGILALTGIVYLEGLEDYNLIITTIFLLYILLSEKVKRIYEDNTISTKYDNYILPIFALLLGFSFPILATILIIFHIQYMIKKQDFKMLFLIIGAGILIGFSLFAFPGVTLQGEPVLEINAFPEWVQPSADEICSNHCYELAEYYVVGWNIENSKYVCQCTDENDFIVDNFYITPDEE